MSFVHDNKLHKIDENKTSQDEKIPLKNSIRPNINQDKPFFYITI